MKYLLLYDEQLEGGLAVAEYTNNNEQIEAIRDFADMWSNINYNADYTEYCYQVDHGDLKRSFDHYMREVLSIDYGLDYLIDCDFQIYEIDEKTYEECLQKEEEYFTQLKNRYPVDVSTFKPIEL